MTDLNTKPIKRMRKPKMSLFKRTKKGEHSKNVELINTNNDMRPTLVDDIHQLSTGLNFCICVMGFLNTMNEKIVSRQIFGVYNHDEPLSLIGALALRGYDIHTKDFVEFFQGSYNGLPDCSLFYRYVDDNNIEIKAIRRKDIK